MAAATLQAEWARLLMASLADAGVRQVVLSPGSRSTPFVLAAAAEERFTLLDVVDERSAAYYAVGLARASGMPALLLCTSGTAAANYLPAVAEAAASHLPLLVVTADRPPELHGCGANQTLDQIKLYGDHVRRFVDLGTPDAGSAALRGLRRVAVQAVSLTLHPTPGPVHLDARARKPLEPEASDAPLRQRIDELRARPQARPRMPRTLVAEEEIADLAAACAAGRRGLLVAGPAPLAQAELAPQLAALAARTGFPFLADASSQLRFGRGESEALWIDGAGLALAAPRWRRRLQADLVIQIGEGLTATAWETFLDESPPREHWVLARHGWPDPASTATRMLHGDLGSTLTALLDRLGSGAPAVAADYRQQWSTAAEAIRRAVSSELAENAAVGLGEQPLSEAVATAELLRALPEGAVLGVGNSLPIRWVETVGRGGQAGLRVISQRGLSGIDGVVSAFAGSARALAAPAGLLIGDLSFLHDLGGLALLRQVAAPVLVLVLHNGGGRIFEQLPIADRAEAELLAHWTTPHELELAPAAALYGLRHLRVATLHALRSALADALKQPLATVIEAVVPPHGAAESLARLRERVARAAPSD